MYQYIYTYLGEQMFPHSMNNFYISASGFMFDNRGHVGGSTEYLYIIWYRYYYLIDVYKI